MHVGSANYPIVLSNYVAGCQPSAYVGLLYCASASYCNVIRKHYTTCDVAIFAKDGGSAWFFVGEGASLSVPFGL